MHIALLVFSKKIWNKFKRFKLRLQTIYQFLAETLLLTSGETDDRQQETGRTTNSLARRTGGLGRLKMQPPGPGQLT